MNSYPPARWGLVDTPRVSRPLVTSYFWLKNVSWMRLRTCRNPGSYASPWPILPLYVCILINVKDSVNCVPFIWYIPCSVPGICTDEHGCWSQHVSNSNSASIKHLSLLPSPTASSQPTLPCSIHHLSSIIHHQWQLLILSLLNYHLDFPNIQ